MTKTYKQCLYCSYSVISNEDITKVVICNNCGEAQVYNSHKMASSQMLSLFKILEKSDLNEAETNDVYFTSEWLNHLKYKISAFKGNFLRFKLENERQVVDYF